MRTNVAEFDLAGFTEAARAEVAKHDAACHAAELSVAAVFAELEDRFWESYLARESVADERLAS